MLHPQQCYYNNLTIYEFSCKCLMQLNRNSSHTNQGRTFQVFFIFTYYYMVFKIALILVLEKKSFFFPVVKYLEVV